MHGYFSNFIDDKGYLVTFPPQLTYVNNYVHSLAQTVRLVK